MIGDAPRPGWWMVRMVRGGPEIPAAIVVVQTTHEPGDPENVMDRSPMLVGYLAGEQVSPARIPWQYGRQIDRAEYEHQVSLLRWAQDHEPDHPIAQPSARVDWRRAPMPF